MILAAPGWRVCVYSTEQSGPVALEVVAWEVKATEVKIGDKERIRHTLEPWVRSEFGEQVAPIGEERFYVGIMAPGEELYDWQEGAEAVWKAYEEAEDRKYLERVKDEG